jgi:hypothetical protein
VTLFGSIGWSASSLDGASDAVEFVGGPSLRWNVLDQGKYKNNVRVQDARLQQLIEAYRDRVRQAARDADNAATDLIKALERERILSEASDAANRSLSLAKPYRALGLQRVLMRSDLSIPEDWCRASDAVNSLTHLQSARRRWSTSSHVDSQTQDQMKRTGWGTAG